MPIYNLNGDTYNIPDNVADQFENENPGAIIQYSTGGDNYDIPVSKKSDFLKDFPDAKYRELSTPAAQQKPADTTTQQPKVIKDQYGPEIEAQRQKNILTPGTDEWRSRTVDVPGENPYNGQTYGAVYDSIISDFGKNIAHPDVDPYAEARAQIIQAGITDDMNPDEADNLALQIREGYANRYAGNNAKEMVSSLPDQVPDIDSMMDGLWYNRDLQGRIDHEARRLGLSRDNYINYFMKPQLAKALSDRYGYDVSSAQHIAGRLLSQEGHMMERVRQNEATAMIGQYAAPYIQNHFAQALSDADKVFQEERSGSMMTPYGNAGQMAGAAIRHWQATDPEKVWEQIKPEIGRMTSDILDNPEFIKEAEAHADEEGTDVNSWLFSRIVPNLASQIQSQFEQMAIEREMPKNTMEYLWANIQNSLIGTVGRIALESQARRRMKAEALQRTEAGQNPNYTPSFGAKIGGGFLAMAPDMMLPMGGPFGLISKISTKPVQGMSQALIADGMRPLLARMAQSSGSGMLSLGAFEGVKGGVEGAFNGTGQGDYLNSRRSADDILMDTVKGIWEKGVPSGFAGGAMIGGPIGQKISNGRGAIANLLGWGAQVGVDAAGATALSVIPRIAKGDITLEEIGQDFASNVGTFAALGLHSKAKEFASLADGGRAWNGVPFTKEEVQLLEDHYLNTFRKQIEEIEKSQKSYGPIMDRMAGIDPQERERMLTESVGLMMYNDLMHNYAIPRETKVKVAQALGVDIPEYAAKPAVLDLIDSVRDKTTEVGLIDAMNFDYNKEGGVADKVMQGKPLDSYDLMLKLLFQDNAAYNEALKKLQAGDQLTDQEKELIAVNNERLYQLQRNYMNQEMDRITSIFEREHNMKPGELRRMLDDLSEGKPVDSNLVGEFEDMLTRYNDALDKLRQPTEETEAPVSENGTGSVRADEKPVVDEVPTEEAPKVNRVVDNAEAVTEETPAKKLEFSLNDEISLVDDDGTIHKGMIVFVPSVSDGTFSIQTDDGRVIYRNASYLQSHVTEHNGEATANNVPQPAVRKAVEPEEAVPAEGTVSESTAADAAPETALSRIPVNEKGEPDYEKAKADDSYDALVEELGEEDAATIAQSEIDDATKRLQRIQKQGVKGATIEEKKRSLSERAAAMKDQQAKIDYWTSVLEVPKSRKAEAERKAAEEAQRKAAEERQAKMQTPEGRAELLSEGKNPQERTAIAKEIYGDDFNANIAEPDTVEELASLLLPYGKLNWEGYDRGTTHVRGLQEELGSQHTRGLSKDKASSAFNSYLARKGEGESLQTIAHQIYEDDANLRGDEHRFSTEEIADAIIRLLLSAEKPTDIRDYTLNSRIEQAEKSMRSKIEQMNDETRNEGKTEDGQAVDSQHPGGETGRDRNAGQTEIQAQDTEGKAGDDTQQPRVEGAETDNGVPSVSDTDVAGGAPGIEEAGELPFEGPSGEDAPFLKVSKDDTAVTDKEIDRAIRDKLDEGMKQTGVPLIDDVEEGQANLDLYNGTGEVKPMGTTSENKIEAFRNDAKDSEEKIKEQRVYHGSGAEFDAFDHSHMGEGAGSQTFGYGTYVTNSKRIGTEYANVTSRGWLYKGMDGKELRASNDKVPEGRYYSDNEIRSFVLDYMNAGNSFEQAVDKVRRNTQSAINDHEEHLSELSPSELKDLEGFRQELKLINSFRPEDFKRDDRYLYDVEIPEENGSYYIDYYGKMGEQKDVLDMVDNALTADGWKRQEIDSRIKFTKGDKQIILTPNQSGADLYAELEDALGSDRAASKFLNNVGVTGIKYPAGTIMGGGDGATNYVIFNESDAKITDRTKFFKTPDGHAYGYTYKGKIYIDPRIATSETPIHEYGHLWAEMKRQTSPEEWNRIKDVLLKDKLVKPFIDKVRRDYPELEGREDDFIEEVLTQFSGKHGADKLRRMAEEIKQDLGGDATAETIAEAAIRKVKSILNEFWKGVADMMGWKYTNAEDIADAVLRDMLNGVNPREQMKAASARLKPQADIERTLMGVHNLSEDKLRKALKQGGLANPSLAVVDTNNHMHTDYGSISLIPKASLIDARTGRNAGTFTADAWTPTYPTVQKRMSDKGQDKFWKDLRTLREEAGEIANKTRMAFDTWLDKEVGQERLAYWYLKEKGLNPETATFDNPYGKEVADRLDALTDDGNKDVRELTEEEIKEVADMYHAYMERIGEPVAPAEDRIKMLQARMDPGKPSPFLKLQQSRLDELQKYGELLHTLNDFSYKARRAAFEAGKVDADTSMRKAQETLKQKGLQQDFDKWLQDKADSYGIEEWLYNGTDDRTGRQKWVRNTLQNASKLMKKEGLNGAVNWSSIGNWIAKVARSEKTLAGIRKNKKNLQTTEEEHEAFRDKWSKVMYDIATKLGKGDSWSGENIMSDILDHKDYAGYLKREYGMELSKEDRDAIDTFINEVQTSYPTGYFETKFERPVMLDEFEIAVVPENTSPDIVEALKNAGLDVRTYDNTGTEDQKDANRTQATMDAVQGRDDIMFQMVGKEGAAEADRAEGNDERSRNLTLAEESEKAGVDAKAIKLATGWERGADGQWRYEIPDADVDILSKYKAKVDEMKKEGVKKPQPIIKLGELLGEDNELFKYYPDLKKTDVLFSDTLPDGTAGSFDGTNIELNTKELNRFEGDDLNNENIYGTLLHEVQHAIQEKEGFAQGGNLQTSTTEDGINAIIEKKERQRADIKTRLDANNKILSDPENLKMSAELEGKTEKEVKDQLTDTVDQQAAEYDTLGLQIERLRHTKAPSMTDAKDLYNRLAGEVESRNVTERMNMSEEERRNSLASETEDIPREDQVIINGEGDESASMGDSPETFNERQERAVREKGVVRPGLADKSVPVIPVGRHKYTGNIAEATKQAKEAAKKKYAPNGKPGIQHYDNFGKKFDYIISGRAIEEGLNPKQQAKSDNKGAHLAMAEHLDEIIGNSIEVEEHPDYMKNENGERDGSKINPDALMHRFYGVVNVDGEPYRVMTLMREDRVPQNKDGLYAYEVQKIEVLNDKTPSTPNGVDSTKPESLTYPLAKLLNNVEKSKDSGKYLLDESKKTQENENNSLKFSKASILGNSLFADGKAPADYTKGEELMHIPFSERLKMAKAEVYPNPTEAQKKAGNYQKGHVQFGGYRMSIENPKGSTRSGVDKNGKPWSIEMQDTYGYIGNKYSADGDHLDFFINDDADLDGFNGRVYVVDQKNEDGTFDEHKVMYGYPDWSVARNAYARNYEPGWADKHVMKVTGVRKEDFDKWLSSSNRKMKPFSEYYSTKNLKDAVADPVDQLLADVAERESVQGPKFSKASNTGKPEDGRDPMTRILDEVEERKDRVRLQKAPLAEEDDIARRMYEEAVSKGTLKFQEAWQDSMISLKKLQEAIEAETGNKANGAEDAYAFENRMHGRAKNQSERFEWQQYQPMLRAFDELTRERGWDNGQTMDYLISKHGLERNSYYGFRDALKEKILDEIREEKDKLDNDYGRRKVDEAYYAGKRAELDERERNVGTEAEEAMADLRNRMAYRKAKEDYQNGTIGYTESIRRIEDLMRSATMRKNPKKGQSASYYDDHVRDYSGLTESFAKEMYDEAQKIKRTAQKTVDPDEKDELWRVYNEKMRQAYITARQVAEDAVFSGESQDSPTPLKDTAAGRLWDRINDATKETLRISYESGMMDKNTYNKVRDMFEYYIPLRGWDENKASDVYNYIGKENVFSPAVKKTWGRTSKAENPLAYIGNIAASTIISGNRNLMKQHFLNYVMNNPTSLTSISESWYENVGTKENPVWVLRTADTAGKSADEIASIVSDFNQEMAEKQADGMAMPVRGRLRMDLNATKGQKAEHVVEVQRGGHTYQVYINGDPKAAQALNGTAAKAVSRISDTYVGEKLGNLNRSMAAFFTSKNPAFVLSNLSRDLNMAGASVAVNEGAEYNAQFAKNVAKVLTPRIGESSSWVKTDKQPTGMMPSLMRKYKNGTLDENNDTERYFKEFMNEGGETGFVNMLSVDSFKKKMQDEIDQMQGSDLLGRGGKETSIGKGLRLMGDTFEFYNRCAEDATRFIVYMTSRQMGKTMEQSIADAKDVTLNFNRKGTGGKGNAEMRDLFIFVNPAIQALANMYRMGRNHPLKLGTVATSFMAGGFMMPILNNWFLNLFGDDDDKQAYWNLPPWVRKNNFVMWIPGTKNFMTIPLAQEFRVFYGVGEMISSACMEHPTKDMGLEIASSVADLVPINPTGNGGNLLVDFMPTGVQPLVQVGENVDFTGKPIWRENEGNKLDPMYTKAYVGTPKWMVKASEKINDWTGGNEGKKGVIEEKMPFWGEYVNNPAVWNHLLQGYLGGMYNTIAKAFDTAVTLGKGETPNIYQVPVLNRFVNRPSERENAGQLGEEYWDMVRERDVLMNELRKMSQKAADGDAEALKRVDEIMASDEYRRAQVIGHYKKILDNLRKGEKAAEQSEPESGARDMIRESIGLYKQQMEDELKAIGGDIDPLQQAYEAFGKATTFTEKNRLLQKIKDLSSRPKNKKPAEEDVEKAMQYIRDDDEESRSGSEKYIKVATPEDIMGDMEITELKRQAREVGDDDTWNELDRQQSNLTRWKGKLGEESRKYGVYDMSLIRDTRQEAIDAAKRSLEISRKAYEEKKARELEQRKKSQEGQ